MKELQELRNEVLNLRNMGELTKQTESILLHKLNALQEAISVTRCSIQLKDGEVPSFAYWLRHHKYEAIKDSNILTKNNNKFVRGKLFKQYRTEYNF